MLHWLNNNLNSRVDGNGRGNENYARELLELFLLGKDAVTGATRYTEDDVYQMTYAVMGYFDDLDPADVSPLVQVSCSTVNQPSCGRGAFTFNREVRNRAYRTKFSDTRWSASPTRPEYKLLFEGTPWQRADTFKANVFVPGGDTLTPYLMSAHPGVAQHLATRLITTFASIEPTVEMVNLIAGDLRANQWRIEPALRRILASSSFFASTSRNDAVFSPVESLISFTRALDLPLIHASYGNNQTLNMIESVRNRLWESGQLPGQPATVFGWLETGKITGGKIHNGTAFASEQFALGRARAMGHILNDIDFARRSVPGFTTRLDWSRFLDPAAPRSPERLLERTAAKLGLTLRSEERRIILDYLKNISLETETPPGELARPRSSGLRAIDWESLDTARFEVLVRMKVPGLIEMLWALASVQTK
jgi:hypothetical protein